MDPKKKKALEAKGFKEVSVAQFLGLSKEEEAIVEIKAALAKKLVETRKRKKQTQTDVAKLVKSSQSRVAKMEACHQTVSIDLMIRTLLKLGVKRNTLAKAIAP
jgi:predicted XRE-type DNA-binding protein